MRRFERYFYFYKLFRGVFSFIKQIVSRELLTFYQAKEFEVRILTSNSFVYPNVTSQFIILKLRKWYRVGEIFGILKKMFSQRSMLGGLLVRAKGRLTKRQRATRQKFQIGSMPFSSPLAPLFYFHKAYPLKYGASSISVSFYLCVCRNIKYL
jgi:hypothetical protein